MKKIYLLFSFTFLTVFSLQSQTAATISNGNWTNPLTWNCTCVPVNGYSITINHSVTLNTSLVFNTGGITVNNSGSLIQDASLNRDIWINGGYMVNNGKSNFRYFLLSAGSGSNGGNFTVSAITNSVAYTNSGSLTMDSMYVAGNFTNTTTGKILGDSLTNASTLINNGRLIVSWVTNKSVFKNYNYQGGYAYTNDGNYENYDSLILTGSVWNKKVFDNKAGAKFNMTKNFHNFNTSTIAVFNNDGNVKVLDSWYNTDTVKGSGAFTVSDTSANSGYMKGTFNFCDLTAPATAPYVDFNTGFISSGITWCSASGIKEYSNQNSFVVYPNPCNGNFSVKGNSKDELSLSDELGRIIYTVGLNETNNFSSTVSDLSNGIYFLKGKDSVHKIVVTK